MIQSYGLGKFDAFTQMHVNHVTHALLIFAHFAACHNIVSITLLRKSSFVIEHTSTLTCHDFPKMNATTFLKRLC